MWLFKKPTPGKDDIKNAYNMSLSLQKLMKKIRVEKERLFDRRVRDKKEVWRNLQMHEKRAESLLLNMHNKLKDGIRKLK